MVFAKPLFVLLAAGKRNFPIATCCFPRAGRPILFPDCVFQGDKHQEDIHRLSSARPGRAAQPDATPNVLRHSGDSSHRRLRHQPSQTMLKTNWKTTFPLRTPLFPSCCFTIETIDRKWAAPLELHSRSGAVRNRVAPGVPSGAPVARSDRQAETAGAVILCSSPWFYTHFLLPTSRQAARALRRTNDLETCVAPIGSTLASRRT